MSRFRPTVKESGDGTPFIVFELEESVKNLENQFQVCLWFPKGTDITKAEDLARSLHSADLTLRVHY